MDSTDLVVATLWIGVVVGFAWLFWALRRDQARHPQPCADCYPAVVDLGAMADEDGLIRFGDHTFQIAIASGSYSRAEGEVTVAVSTGGAAGWSQP